MAQGFHDLFYQWLRMGEQFFCDNSVTLKINLVSIGTSGFFSGR